MAKLKQLGAKPFSPRSGGDGVAKKWWKVAYTPVAANRMLRMHWSRRARERQTWSTLLAIGGPAPRKAPWRARVSILVGRDKLQDPDNAVASLKPLLDAMVRRGWLTDDSSVHLELQVTEEVSSASWTEIRWFVLQKEGG